MGTRFNSTSTPRFNVPGLASGYEGGTADLVVPSVGVEDVDIALFNLFDTELPLFVSTSDRNRQETKRVPVVFASAEKWALAKKNSPIRDKNGSLILPLITVVRTSIRQAPDSDIAGRGTNQQTGEIVIRRRLDNSDRRYQNLINRALIQHQTNLAVSPEAADADQVATERVVGELSDDPLVLDGALLAVDRKHNIHETIVIPAPQFFTATYDVTLWTQYTVQMSQLIEQLIASFLPQGNAWKLETSKGYWFVATIDGNTLTSETNIDNMSQEERIIKYKFVINVPGYILATGMPGAPVPIRRYVSSPSISFDVSTDPGEQVDSSLVDDPYLGADDPTLPLTSDRPRRADARDDGSTRLYPLNQTSPDDPAVKALPRGRSPARYKKIIGIDRKGRTITRYARVLSTNTHTGETVLSPDASLDGLNVVVVD